MPSHDHHTRRILTQIEAEDKISQRSLAKELGIALGLTNLLIRRIVKKGWVKVINVRPNRVRYLITPTGIAEKARITRSRSRSSEPVVERQVDELPSLNGGTART